MIPFCDHRNGLYFSLINEPLYLGQYEKDILQCVGGLALNNNMLYRHATLQENLPVGIGLIY